MGGYEKSYQPKLTLPPTSYLPHIPLDIGGRSQVHYRAKQFHPLENEMGKPLKKLSPKHRAIAEYVLANPLANRSIAAAHFAVSPQWLAEIMNCDAFKEYLKELEAVSVSVLAMPLRNRVHAVSERAVERLAAEVETSQDPRFILDVADKTLHRLGYAPSKGPEGGAVHNTTLNQNLYVADPAALAMAREKMKALANAPAAQVHLPASLPDETILEAAAVTHPAVETPG